jgi:hypothetical protein
MVHRDVRRRSSRRIATPAEDCRIVPAARVDVGLAERSGRAIAAVAANEAGQRELHRPGRSLLFNRESRDGKYE